MEIEIKRRWWSLLPPIKVEIGAEYENAADGVKLGAAIKVLVGKDAEQGTRADLTDAVLTGAVLTGAVLTDADLTRAVLTRAVLTGAVLTRADLTGAVLTRAVLTDAVLTDAVLTRADLTRAVLTRAVLTRAVLTGADLTGAKDVPDFTMPDGLKFSAYLRDVVPALLTAGGKTIAEIVASGAWECHSWENCPMHAAFNISSSEEAPPLLRARVKEFVQFFDAGLIPCPAAQEAEA